MKLRMSCLYHATMAMLRIAIPEFRRAWRRARSEAIRKSLMALDAGQPRTTH